MQNQGLSEEQSKDNFFKQLETISQRMIEKHGKDFAMGALVLAARWIAEDRTRKAERAN